MKIEINAGELAYLMQETKELFSPKEPESTIEEILNNTAKADAMNFGQAIMALKSGKRVARRGWNGNGMFICFVHWKDWSVNPAETHKTSTHLAPWIGMKTADNKFVPWIASQTDIIAEDWEVIE